LSFRFFYFSLWADQLNFHFNKFLTQWIAVINTVCDQVFRTLCNILMDCIAWLNRQANKNNSQAHCIAWSFLIFVIMATKKHLLVIGGPTASGKTRLAIQLAQTYGTEIVSADSRQFFREMHIGTARPTSEELAAAPHHFVGHRSITEAYSVGAFARKALTRLDELFQRHDIVILTGGSGLYLQAICQGLDHFPEVSSAIRQQVERDYHTKGIEALQEELSRTDPDYFREVDQQNPHRLMRALSVIRQSGRPFSFFRKENQAPRPFTPIYLALQHPRTVLYDRINRRVEAMVEAGLEDEARKLYPQRQLTALQTVGYQEWFEHFAGAISREEAIARIQQHTRNYAKRQLTWLRRDGFWKHFTPSETDTLLPVYLEKAFAKNWQLTADREEETLRLLASGTQVGRLTLHWYKDKNSPGKRALAIRQLEGLAFAQKWLLHEGIRRGGEHTVRIISEQPVELLPLLSGYQHIAEHESAPDHHTYIIKSKSD